MALKPALYPRELRTVGDHLKKRKVVLGLRQSDAAVQIGVTADTVRSGRKLIIILRDHDFPIDCHVADDRFRPIRPADTDRVDEPGIAQAEGDR